MADLTPELAPKILAACTENAEEAAGAIGRTFDGEFVLKPGEPAPYSAENPPEGLEGGGLLVLLKFGERGLMAALPASSGLVPDWVQTPDDTGKSKLSTLAQELSMLLVPEDLMADDSPAAWVGDLAAALEQCAPGEGAMTAQLELVQGETLSAMHLVWPLTAPDACFSAAADAEEGAAASSQEEAANEEDSQEASPGGAAAETEDDQIDREEQTPRSRVLRWLGGMPRDYNDLPSNTRSLLQVEVPLSVMLAKKKYHIRDIVDLGPGSILTFDKLCDDPIELEIGDQTIAAGEPVKVGEKFGFRVHEMVLPREHFSPMQPVRHVEASTIGE